MNPTKQTTALAILGATSYEDKYTHLFRHWGDFVEYVLPPGADHENDPVEWTEDRFEVLYRAAAQWLITDLLARVEALESPQGGDAP